MHNDLPRAKNVGKALYLVKGLRICRGICRVGEVHTMERMGGVNDEGKILLFPQRIPKWQCLQRSGHDIKLKIVKHPFRVKPSGFAQIGVGIDRPELESDFHPFKTLYLSSAIFQSSIVSMSWMRSSGISNIATLPFLPKDAVLWK